MSSFTELGEAFSIESLKNTEKEIRQGYRITILGEFRGESDKQVKITFPSVEADSESSRVYMQTMNELLTSEKKVLTEGEMEKLLAERSIWSKEQEDKMEELDLRIADLMREGQTMHAKKRVNKTRLDEVKKEYETAKKEKSELLSRKNNFMQNTVEGMAEIESLKNKLFHCVFDLDGNSLWTDYAQFKKESNRVAIFKLLQEAMVFWAGLPQGVLSALPDDDIVGEPALEQSQESESGS
jgi:hypothetical protein